MQKLMVLKVELQLRPGCHARQLRGEEERRDKKGETGLRLRLRNWVAECCFCSIIADNWKFREKSQGYRQRNENPSQKDNNEVIRIDGLTQGKREVRRKKMKPRETPRRMPMSIDEGRVTEYECNQRQGTQRRQQYHRDEVHGLFRSLELHLLGQDCFLGMCMGKFT